MSKYIIKNCPCIFLNSNNFYVCDDLNNTKLVNCKDITGCLLKQIVDNLNKVINDKQCDNCDGCGYYNGCNDAFCGTYQAIEIIEMLEIEEVYE